MIQSMTFTFRNGFFGNTTIRSHKLSLLERARLKDRLKALQDITIIENVEIINHDWDEQEVKISGNQV